MTNATAPVRILALGGSTKPMAASERALRIAAQAATDAGAEVTFVTGRSLLVPIYDTETTERTPETVAIVEALRSADGVIIASPGYHGSFSGMVKNALDYAEDLRHDDRPYLEDRAVGLHRRRARLADGRRHPQPAAPGRARPPRLAGAPGRRHQRLRRA